MDKTMKQTTDKWQKASVPQLDDPSPQEIDALVALFNQARYAEAIALAQTMTERFPLHGFGWKALGALHTQMGRSADALAPMQRAGDLLPRDAEVHNNLGATLHDLQRLEEAEACYRRALDIRAEYAEAFSNLGLTLHDLGRLDEAESCCRRALELQPDFAKAHNNLGLTLNDLGRLGSSEASYRRALAIKPDFVNALNNLALLLNEQCEFAAALLIVKQSLQVEETAKAKSIFVASVKHLQWKQDGGEMRTTLVRALTAPWARPSELTRACTELVMLNPDINECVARAAAAWPQRLSTQELFGAAGLAAFATDPLLLALLLAAPISDLALERFLTMARPSLLAATCDADDQADACLDFFSALARQCFINEYIFAPTAEEFQAACELRDSLLAALEAKAQVPDLWPLTVAAYFPLCSLPHAARLLDRQWPEAVAAVLEQQLREPEEEMHLRASIPRLTSIEDEISLLVQDQYEQNPYPRWVNTAPTEASNTVVEYLSRLFPLSPLRRIRLGKAIDVLIAGCGTGQHSIDTALRFPGARVLAVDLSLSSLAYAKRKTQELGLSSIEYAQADLLKLGSSGLGFDLIESVGVLHHLADPWAGWRVLLSLLRPGGVMCLGFYSEAARGNVVRIRAFIAAHGYGSSAMDIRRCRQELMAQHDPAFFGNTLRSPDFFSISACRDLLFHVQEQRLTLTRIEAFLRENDLAFLGFDRDPVTLNAYRMRYPDDRAGIDLSQWQAFENDNPDSFSGMYQFWIQKPGAP